MPGSEISPLGRTIFALIVGAFFAVIVGLLFWVLFPFEPAVEPEKPAAEE
jgi:hypothetical protein